MAVKLRTSKDLFACMATEHATLADAIRIARMQVDEFQVTSATVLSLDGDLLFRIWRSHYGEIYEDDYQTAREVYSHAL
jgi:hypothetical protein